MHYSLNTSNSKKVLDIFDSPEPNFDSWPTKTIGWPDLCHSKPLAKFKRNPKRNVGCRLNTRKSADDDSARSIVSPLFGIQLASDFSSVQDGRVETWVHPNILLNTYHNFLPSPLFSLRKSWLYCPLFLFSRWLHLFICPLRMARLLGICPFSKFVHIAFANTFAFLNLFFTRLSAGLVRSFVFNGA